jgi:hypothetical protein
MPLSEEELLARDAGRNIGEELLAAIRDVNAGNIGATYSVEAVETKIESSPDFDIDYAKAKPSRFAESQSELTVVLDSDVAAVFKTSEAVNKILRAIISSVPRY